VADQPLKAPRHPIADTDTGLVSRPWLAWLQDLQDRVTSGPVVGSGGGSLVAGGKPTPPDVTNITVDVQGVAGTGTPGRIAAWTDGGTIGDSPMSEVGSVIHVDGTLQAQTLIGLLAASNIAGFPNDPTVFLDGAGEWVRPSASHIVGEVAGGPINGTNTTFTTANPANELVVFLNGLELTRGQDWQPLSSTAFSIYVAPLATAPADIVTVSYAL
jgi:hypothetical protein